MVYYKRNLKEVDKMDCSCEWSRRPFVDHPAYDTASLHGTIFTAEKEAFPHLHVPVGEREATHETYVVTHEDTREGALIYLGKGAVKAVPGTVVYVHPGIVHGGIGTFTPLILGSPGFVKEGSVEIKDAESREAIIEGSKSNIITPDEYRSDGFVPLTAEQPALDFSYIYRVMRNQRNISLLLAQTKDNQVYCAATYNSRMDYEAFENVEGPTYLTVIASNGGLIRVNRKEVPVKELDTLLLEPGTNFSLDRNLAAVIMAIHPDNLEALIKRG